MANNFQYIEREVTMVILFHASCIILYEWGFLTDKDSGKIY